MKLKTLPFIALLLAAFVLCGATCRPQLEPGGAYAPVTTNEFGAVVPAGAPETTLFHLDSAFAAAHDALDLAFKFERDNRDLLWGISHEIKHSLDAIRPTAVRVRFQYASARAVYQANPVPANLSQMQAALAECQRLASSASAALAAAPQVQSVNPQR